MIPLEMTPDILNKYNPEGTSHTMVSLMMLLLLKFPPEQVLNRQIMVPYPKLIRFQTT